MFIYKIGYEKRDHFTQSLDFVHAVPRKSTLLMFPIALSPALLYSSYIPLWRKAT